MAGPRSRKPHPKKHNTNTTVAFNLFVKIARSLLLIFSCVSFLFGLFYLYPSFVAACTDTLPQLWVRMNSWLTPPVLFVLMNLVVGAVVITSGFVQRAKKWNAPVIEEEQEEEDEEEDEVDMKFSSAPGVNDRSNRKPSASSRAEGKPLTRLVRSKSEQIPAFKRGDLELHRLKKSGTLESTTSASAHKKTSSAPPNVVVVDNPSAEEEVIPGGEEVDKQAEAFIGKFYQQMKLQRLESFLRYKDRINRSHR